MSISKLNFKERSLLFAQLSRIAYFDIKEAFIQAKKLGFNTIEFYDRDGAQSYRFMNKTDLVISARGTEPTCKNDIGADLNAIPAVSETVSRVHRGFKAEVDELWPMIVEDITRTQNLDKDLWFCGHSLGGAMATIMAGRCFYNNSSPNPVELYTYGSPRVGWPGYVNNLQDILHHRWVNNNDLVASVPPRWLGYRHHGTEHYLNSYGNVRQHTKWQTIKDKWRGYIKGIKQGKIDGFSDHAITDYIAHLEMYAADKEYPQQ